MAKIAPDKEQVDDNVNTLARIATQYGVILASALRTEQAKCCFARPQDKSYARSRDRTLFCRFIVKNRRLE